MPRLPRLRRGVVDDPLAPASDPDPTPPPADGGAASLWTGAREDGASGAPAALVPAPTAAAPVEPMAPAPSAPAPVAAPLLAVPPDGPPPEPPRPRIVQRGRLRRRLRELRQLRELAFRDLGGLVFDLHRFGADRPDLVAAKLGALADVDRELRTIERVLRERREVVELREVGLAGCPRCGTVHGSDANFCPTCGLPRQGGPAPVAHVTVAPAAAPPLSAPVQAALPAAPDPVPAPGQAAPTTTGAR